MLNLFIYGLAALAVVVPSFLAWRYRGKCAEVEAEAKAEREAHIKEVNQLIELAKSIKQEFEDYREIVENSGHDPASIIDFLRQRGKIKPANKR